MREFFRKKDMRKFYIWKRQKQGRNELPQFVRTTQKSTYVGNIQFYAEWRSVSGATPVLLWIRS